MPLARWSIFLGSEVFDSRSLVWCAPCGDDLLMPIRSPCTHYDVRVSISFYEDDLLMRDDLLVMRCDARVCRDVHVMRGVVRMAISLVCAVSRQGKQTNKALLPRALYDVLVSLCCGVARGEANKQRVVSRAWLRYDADHGLVSLHHIILHYIS